MDLLHQFLDLFRDLPEVVLQWTREYGAWSLAIIFAIIFVETGVVIMPFLPGDSLLFTGGAIARTGAINIWALVATVIAAAVLGDAVNYHIGAFLGDRLRSGEELRFIKRRHLDRTHEFFEKHGGKAIVLARFVPIVRTFAPFVAGAGAMSYRRFAAYNVIGAVAWTGICVGAGWAFGGFEIVQKHFELVLVGIVIVSIMPMVVERVVAWRRSVRARAQDSAP